jgi:hypothetical protein
MTSFNGSGGVPGVDATNSDATVTIRGISTHGTNGIYGQTSDGSYAGINGANYAASAGYGVYGYANASSGIGVEGVAAGTSGMGAQGNSTGSSGYGLYGIAHGSNSYGVYGQSVGTGTVYGGYFAGNVNVTGTLSKGAGSFLIDHPLDPENKLLEHSFVESPERKNVYDGVATADSSGEAAVQLPGYFDALNTDLRYQLTAIGKAAPGLFVKEEVAKGRFVIAGAAPGQKVSWQVTGNRQDAFARATPLVVERDKPSDERGYYLHPEAFDKPKEKGVDAKRHPKPRPAPIVPAMK